MDARIAAAAAIGGYLLGSISFGRLFTALSGRRGGAPTAVPVGIEGSDTRLVLTTVSATSVSANVGAKWGFLTYLFDVLKVFAPVLFLRLQFPGAHYHLLAGTTGVAGHIWPLWHGFRGGRGVSAIYGGVFAIDWIGVFVAAFGGMFIGMVILHDLYFIYYTGLMLIIPWLWWRTGDAWVALYALVVNLLFVFSSLAEARQWFRIKNEPHWNDWTEAWQISGMGRGIVKMGKRIGLIRRPAPHLTHTEADPAAGATGAGATDAGGDGPAGEDR